MSHNEENGTGQRVFIVSLEGFSLYYLADSNEVVSVLGSISPGALQPNSSTGRNASNQ